MKKYKYKILLMVGLLPFIINLIISLFAIKSGFQLFDLLPVYGLKAFVQHFYVTIVLYSPIFVVAFILIIFSIYKIIKERRSKK